MSTTQPIAYVEFNVPDISAAKAFYGRVFGWTFTDYGPNYCEFRDGHLKGGFFLAEPVVRGGPLLLFQAPTMERLAAMASEVEAAGGTIVKPTFAYPGGHRFQFTDPAGHELGVFAEE